MDECDFYAVYSEDGEIRIVKTMEDVQKIVDWYAEQDLNGVVVYRKSSWGDTVN